MWGCSTHASRMLFLDKSRGVRNTVEKHALCVKLPRPWGSMVGKLSEHRQMGSIWSMQRSSRQIGRAGGGARRVKLQSSGVETP